MPELLVRDGLCISIHTPLAGSDSPSASTAPIRQYFNPHSPCGERLRVCCAQSECRSISIHTPLAGSDAMPELFVRDRLRISIHTPLAGSDEPASATPSAPGNFNPHSPCGERLWSCRFRPRRRYFNPHSPCGERPKRFKPSTASKTFQSTLPLRGATADRMRHAITLINFNPHSPCGERRPHLQHEDRGSYFNPHSPCGERPQK